ncbi:hypothetical protein GNF76_28150 [Pseudomonas sp. CCM 7893]|uniref:Uncharacterized protein n=1 Tax=Pseudomonas spelaei TaxID=1055469 RepID=A0A6I3WD87_9PSED|nr:hypothetical protein [Pseudomonas spelaei]MUF08215.1 hypothetical protein [Pseudomonas spelaei]
MISLDFLQGKVTHDDLSLLLDSALDGQTNSLKEDMLQVEYPEGHLLDVGWYPSFDPKGSFQIKVIKDYEWDFPILALTANSIEKLKDILLLAQSAIYKGPQQPVPLSTAR